MNSSRQSKHRKRTKRSDVGGDVITVSDVGSGSVVAAGRGAVAQLSQSADLHAFDRWRTEMETKISVLPGLSAEERLDVKEQIQKIAAEATKGESTNSNRLEKLINTLAVMSNDIFEVAIATLMNPLAGIGLVLKKVGDKAKIEPATDR